jgi:hypothetical protein
MKKYYFPFHVSLQQPACHLPNRKTKTGATEAQLQMIQKTSAALMKAMQKGKLKQVHSTPPITADADQFKPRLNSFETSTLWLPDSAKIRLIPNIGSGTG